MERSGDRGSGISVPVARHDDDDDIYIEIAKINIQVFFNESDEFKKFKKNIYCRTFFHIYVYNLHSLELVFSQNYSYHEKISFE